MSAQIDLYGAGTSNVYKIELLLDELGIEYNFHQVNIMAGDQFKPEFLKISPNNKVPAIVDNTLSPPLNLFESGAILTYFAEKEHKFLPDQSHPRERAQVFQWLNHQVSGFGPFFGQYAHFLYFAPEKSEYSIKRYTNELIRLLNVIDTQLKDNTYIAGNEYTIADIAYWGWALYLPYMGADADIQFNDEAKYVNIKRWLNLLSQRPPVAKLLAKIQETMKSRNIQKKY
ncbi:hypothetical protein CYY_000257 [Polysphondylium violaceum]|uniref:Glutathione S-transferase n=1 Tax=Polysphondylium violaceum TaxID=133409 RepID=A0A8J4V2J2_9MYCE|nr:hypothetical protein CYY_000257 [Polysphondylium violaceum]